MSSSSNDFPDQRFDAPQSPLPPRWPRRLARAARWSALIGGGTVAAVAAYVCVLVYTTPQVDELQRAQAVRPSVILSSDGEVIGRFAVAYQAPVTLKEVSPDLINALIATEDHRFYAHSGLDPKRLVASAWNTLRGDTQGGSTLTQQLARNLFPVEIGNERSLNRKLREAITALRLERTSTKDQILESYLNSAPFLYNVRGIEMAARTYFDRPAAQLDTAQCATLVGMLKGTQRYNPVRNPERARERRNLVMAQMVKRGTLEQARYAQLRAQPLVLSFKRPEDGDIGQARHFVAHVREQLVEWADANDVDLDTDGVVIRTTLDAKMQRLAQDAVVQQVALLQRIAGEEWSEQRPRTARIRLAAAVPGKGEPAAPFAFFWKQRADMLREIARETPQFRLAKQAGQTDAQAFEAALADTDAMNRLREEKTRLSAGFIAIDPTSGAVRAWVGSPDFAREQFDHVAQAKRQPGSTFKPFVYGAAMQRGISTERAYLDGAIDIALADGGVWQPTDASGPSGEMMTMREGLVQSKNTITAQVMQEVGAEAVAVFAQAAGVRDSKLDPVPSLALGTSPVSLLELGNAYATLAALGERRAPLLITRITDRNGKVLANFDSAAERVLDQVLVEKLVDVMRGVVQTGTGAAIRGDWGVKGDLAGKTGTTQNNTDGWFMLIGPKLVAGAWVGFNDPRVAIRSNHWGQGGHNALRLVGAFMQQGQKAKLIDAKATFPQVERDPPEEAPEVLPGTPPDAASAPAGPLSGLARWLG
ncbi:MAG: transglycosylase domain-containing protein, partial [Rhizobiales bacterium]|nr:transglycosylase domain-containing protein [Rhizobacter sp.]